jgi:hypothetical protein
MPNLLTTEERQQLSRQLERTDSAPVELNSEMLMFAHQRSLKHGRIRMAVEESGLCFCVAPHFNQHVACDAVTSWPQMTCRYLFCRVGRQNIKLGVIMIPLLM